MRNLFVSLLVVLATTSVGFASVDADDHPIVPTAPRDDWNAAAITANCMQLVAKPKQACDAAVRAFCKDPLDAKQALPTVNAIISAGEPKCGAAAPDAHINTAASVLGADWQTEVLTGLVAFLEERAKAEVIASLATQIKTELCGSTDLMPTTCALLDGVDPYTNPVSWTALKAAFSIDLEGLPERAIRKLLPGDKAEPFVSLVQLIELVDRGSNPLQSLIGLQGRYATIATKADCEAKPYSCSLLLLGKAVEIMYLDGKALTVKPGNELEFGKVAVRLFYEAGKSLGVPDSVLTTPETVQRDLQQVQDTIGEIVRLVTRAKKVVDDQQDPTTKTSPAAVISAFKDYRVALASAVGLVVVVAEARGIGPNLKDVNISDVLAHVSAAIDAGKNADWVRSFVEVQAALKAANVKPPGWFAKYGGLVATIAAAKSKDEVQSALESAALPVGGWRNKRGTHHSALMIQAYVGAQGGEEWLGGNNTPSGSQLQGGLFAPVGLETSWGFCDGWSGGFMLSALDLGALVDVRDSGMSDSGVGTTSKIGFRQVFSPGAYGVLGLGLGKGGIPLALGAGISLSPQLRSVSLTDGTTQDVSALRFSVFLAVDVSLFQL